MNMGFQTNKIFTSDFKVILFVPFFILFLFFLTDDTGFILLLLPTFMILFIIQNHLQSFHTIEDKLVITRSLSSYRVNEANELKVNIKIKNNSGFDSHQIELIDDIPDVFDLIDSTNVFIFTLKKEEEILLSYKIKCYQLGLFNFKSVYITHTDYFGLTLENFMVTPQTISLTVTPIFEKFDKLPIFSYWMKYFNGFFISKQIGTDTDFRGIREYQLGDKLQRINWKATSRFQGKKSQNLFSNIYSNDKAIDTELILDLTYESFSIYQELMRAICSLAEFLLRNRNKVGVTIAKQFPEHFNFRMGTNQLKSMIDKLVTYESDSEENSIIIADRLVHVSQNFKPKSIIILLSPLLNEYVIEFCLKIKKICNTLIVIKINALDKQLLNIGKGIYDADLPMNIPLFFNIISFDFSIKSFITKNKLLSMSIPVLEWSTENALKGVIDNYKYGIRM